MITNGAQSLDDYVVDEARRLARGWRLTVEKLERLKRLDEGRPLVHLARGES